MSMGYWANWIDWIEEADIKKICPAELEAFNEAINNSENEDFNINELVDLMRYNNEENEEIYKKELKTFKKLSNAFKAKTGYRLELYIVDEESYTDELVANDYYFVIDKSLLVKDPKAIAIEKKYKVTFDRAYFTSYG